MDTNLTMSMEAYAEVFGGDDLNEEDFIAEYQKARSWWKHAKWWYFLVQRLVGLLILALSAVIVPLADGDATHLLILGPLAVYCLFSQKYIFSDGFLILDQVMDPLKYQ